MIRCFPFAMVLIVWSIAMGQVTPEQADANLKAKQAARAAAAAQPSKLTQGDVDALMAELNKLRAESAALRKDLDDIKKGPKVVPPKPPPVAAPAVQNPDRAKRYEEIIDLRKATIETLKAQAIGANPTGLSHYGFRTQYDKDKVIEGEVERLQVVEGIVAINPSAWTEYLVWSDAYPEEHLIGKSLKDAQVIIGVPLKKIQGRPGVELEQWSADLGYSPKKGRKETQKLRLNVSVKTGEVVSQTFTLSPF